MSPPLGRVEREDLPGTALVRVCGEVDLSNAAALEERILALTASARAVLVDLTEVEYIDSAGVGLLQRTALAVLSRRGQVGFVAPPSSAAGRVVALAALDQVLPVHASREAALRNLAQA